MHPVLGIMLLLLPFVAEAGDVGDLGAAVMLCVLFCFVQFESLC
jgi:hypothetical protein